MDDFYTIGKMAILSDVSVDQLRNYDKLGLLSPDVRGDNNYRYYSEKQLEDILIIKELKNIGVPLKTIKDVIGKGDLETIRQTLEETMLIKREAIYNLQKQYDALTDALIGIERAISHRKDIGTKSEVEACGGFTIIPIAERPIISIRQRSRCYRSHHYTERYIELQNLIHSAKIDVGRNWFILYHDPYQCIFDWGEEAEGDMEFFANVKRWHAGMNQNCRIFGGFLAACATYIGPYDSDAHKRVYEELSKWAKRLGYRNSGISYQELVVGRYTTNNPEEFITKIYLPLDVTAV